MAHVQIYILDELAGEAVGQGKTAQDMASREVLKKLNSFDQTYLKKLIEKALSYKFPDQTRES